MAMICARFISLLMEIMPDRMKIVLSAFKLALMAGNCWRVTMDILRKRGFDEISEQSGNCYFSSINR